MKELNNKKCCCVYSSCCVFHQDMRGSSGPTDTPAGPMGPGGLNLGGMDFSALLNNPALMNMVSGLCLV